MQSSFDKFAQEAKDRAVGLCDCNNFFVSCERVIDKTLWSVPVIVLSSNDGCVVARSNEAKALGIKMGSPYFQIAGFCKSKGVRVLSGNLSFYSKVSAAVMDVLRRFSDVVEVYSIDEAFLNLKIANVPDPTAYCRKIRKTVWEKCRIPISIGISPNKTLSKLAAEFAKKTPNTGGVFWLDDRLIKSGFVNGYPCSEIWGIGPKTSKQLGRMNIITCGELLKKDELWIKRNFGIPGLCVYWELQGRMVHWISPSSKAPKSIQVSRTFGRKLTSFDELLDPLLCFTVSACSQMRKARLAAGKLGIYISTDRFAPPPDHYYNWADIKFSSPKFADGDFIAAAQKLLAAIYRTGYQYNKCGVMLHDLSDVSSGMQTALFDAEGGDIEVSPKKTTFSKAIDRINDEYKKSVIRPALLFNNERDWAPKSEYRSGVGIYEARYEKMAKPNEGGNERRAFKTHALDCI